MFSCFSLSSFFVSLFLSILIYSPFPFPSVFSLYRFLLFLLISHSIPLFFLSHLFSLFPTSLFLSFISLSFFLTTFSHSFLRLFSLSISFLTNSLFSPTLSSPPPPHFSSTLIIDGIVHPNYYVSHRTTARVWTFGQWGASLLSC